MKNFQIKSFLITLFFSLLLYWNYHLILLFFSNLNHQKDFKNSANKLNLISQDILKITEGATLEEIQSRQNNLRENIFKNFRVQYGNGEIISYLASLANTFKLPEARPSILSIKPFQKRNEENLLKSEKPNIIWENVEVKFEFKGRFHEAIKIINLMEKSNYLLKIKRIQLARSNQDVKGPLQNLIHCEFLRISI